MCFLVILQTYVSFTYYTAICRECRKNNRSYGLKVVRELITMKVGRVPKERKQKRK